VGLADDLAIAADLETGAGASSPELANLPDNMAMQEFLPVRGDLRLAPRHSVNGEERVYDFYRDGSRGLMNNVSDQASISDPLSFDPNLFHDLISFHTLYGTLSDGNQEVIYIIREYGLSVADISGRSTLGTTDGTQTN